MNDAATFAYDQMLYPGFPFSQTHPGRLATLASFHGMQPAPPARCRMLELGCGDGGNLIPVAYQYPDSVFLGVDLSARAIEIGQKAVARLGLRNIDLRALDITEMTPDDGQFDYIVGHGVYSWVPPHVRAKILSIFRNNLSRQGVAYVSYNCHPGSYLRDLARSIMLYHVRDNADPQQRVQQGRALLQVLAEMSNDKEVYGVVLRSQYERISKMQEAVLHHDDLDAGATAFFLHQVVEDAAREGLQYLTDATAPLMTGALLELQSHSEPAIKLLQQIPVEDWVTREQYLDFIKGRMFRETLFCHHEIELRRPVALSRIRDFQISTDIMPGAPDLDPQAPGRAEFKTRAGQRMSTDHGLSKAVLVHLGAIWPQAIGFDELVTAALARLGPAADSVRENLDEQLESLTEILMRSFCAGVIDVDVFPPRLAAGISERPEASLLARKQAETGPLLTNLRHCTVVLDDPISQRLLTLLDGTRTIDQLMSDLAAAAPQIARKKGDGDGGASAAPIISRENMERNLELLARLALLVA
ncbi:MAG: methyltransferase regulatory domain-containing protein [Xanthobacteraceae bacterium]